MKIEKLRNCVTYFSAELKQKAEQEEEVVVGGKIKNVIPPLSEEFPQFILILDDYVGETYVSVPTVMMNEFCDELAVGKFVLLEGYVNVVTRKVKNEMVRDVSVYVYGMKDLTEFEEDE